MRDILKKLQKNLIKANNILKLDEITNIDIKRSQRAGFPEAIFSPSKDYDDLLIIIQKYYENDDALIITKLDEIRFEHLKEYLDDFLTLDYNKRGEILVINNKKELKEFIGIIAAGTSDLNIAEEAKVIIEQRGCKAITSYDVGEGGFVALNSMLQSYAPGIAVVSIDNSFGAAVFALSIMGSRDDF